MTAENIYNYIAGKIDTDLKKGGVDPDYVKTLSPGDQGRNPVVTWKFVADELGTTIFSLRDESDNAAVLVMECGFARISDDAPAETVRNLLTLQKLFIGPISITLSDDIICLNISMRVGFSNTRYAWELKDCLWTLSARTRKQIEGLPGILPRWPNYEGPTPPPAA